MSIDFGKSERARRCAVGGLGSGERMSKKDTVEHCCSIDTTRLKQWNLLVPGITDRARFLRVVPRRQRQAVVLGQLRSHRRVECRFTPAALLDEVHEREPRLCGAAGDDPVPPGREAVVVRPPAVAGQRRVRPAGAELYLSEKYFGCRHCFCLTYRSQQESDSRVYALARAGLGAMPAIEGASVTQLGPWPRRADADAEAARPVRPVSGPNHPRPIT